jgi:ABC-type nitrate/sulfonate/bicarbonate transport system permease component
LIGLIPVLRNTAYPFVVASQSLPVLALAPLLVLWFGFGIVPRVIIVVQVVFFPVAIATITGLGAVSQQALVFGRTLGASWWNNFQTEAVFSSLVLITAIGVGAFMLMSVLERIVVPWHERFRDEA